MWHSASFRFPSSHSMLFSVSAPLGSHIQCCVVP
jgi:hypothetical protein